MCPAGTKQEVKMGKEVPTWLVWVVVLALFANAFAWGFSGDDVEVEVDFSEQNAKLDSLGAEIVGLRSEVDSLQAPASEGEEEVAPGSFVLSKSEFEDEALEAEALVLATESVESRDFRKAAFFALLEAEVDIDGYKDITEVRILDTDVDEDEVEFSVKLFYFLDDDEDETERARLVDFTVVVDDLDFDDDFEDGEVDEDYLDSLEVLRIYE